MGRIDSIFEKAGIYLENISDNLEDDSSSNYSLEERMKISEDMLEVDAVRREVAACWVYPDIMEKEKDEKLVELIQDNNDGGLTSEAIIKFLTDLFVCNGEDFSDFDKSWKSSLDHVYKNSSNPQLITLTNELFNVSELGVDSANTNID